MEIAGIALGIVGVLLLAQGDAFTASPAGLIAMTIAAIGFGAGSVLSQHVLLLAPSFAGFASQVLGGGLVLIVLSAVADETFHWPPQPSAAAAWVYLVAFGSLVAFSAYMFLLGKTRPALATSYSFVNPVVGVLLGVTLGGEVVTSHEWLAIGIIILGVTVLILGRR
jgi:drug/metabolite transporter (DMT)-like permease